MSSKRTRALQKKFAAILSIVLSVAILLALTGSYLFYESYGRTSFCDMQTGTETVSAARADAPQGSIAQPGEKEKLRVKNITRAEILDSAEEDFLNELEEAASSRTSIRFSYRLFLYLVLAALLYALAGNIWDGFLSKCRYDAIIIDYIHRSDGKIKD